MLLLIKTVSIISSLLFCCYIHIFSTLSSPFSPFICNVCLHVCERRLKKILECNKVTQCGSRMEGAPLRQFTLLYDCFCDANLEIKSTVRKSTNRLKKKKKSTTRLFLLSCGAQAVGEIYFFGQFLVRVSSPDGRLKCCSRFRWEITNQTKIHSGHMGTGQIEFWHTYAVAKSHINCRHL